MGFFFLSDPLPGLARRAAIDGPISIYTVASLKEEIGCALADHAALEIDLSAVDEIDTAGLQLMLMAKRVHGKSIQFTAHSVVVLDMLELSNLAGAVGDPLLLTTQGCSPT